jgi:hypothetical protein
MTRKTEGLSRPSSEIWNLLGAQHLPDEFLCVRSNQKVLIDGTTVALLCLALLSKRRESDGVDSLAGNIIRVHITHDDRLI